MTSRNFDVGGVEDFADGVPKLVCVNAREVVVVKWRTGLFALRNVCPHQSQRLHTGTVRREVTASVDGELAFGEPVLVCPWHNWPFALRTGHCTVDPHKRVRSFEVRVERGRVIVCA
jgi:nitrite reductase/ring-hydroxylating ferredoxin subunit